MLREREREREREIERERREEKRRKEREETCSAYSKRAGFLLAPPGATALFAALIEEGKALVEGALELAFEGLLEGFWPSPLPPLHSPDRGVFPPSE